LSAEPGCSLTQSQTNRNAVYANPMIDPSLSRQCPPMRRQLLKIARFKPMPMAAGF
jgi:hypothetical protein